jgi:hypothetical protein
MAPMFGKNGRAVGVAYRTFTVHVAPGFNGVAKEQVVAVTLKNVPLRMVSPVICNGAAPVFVTVTTLVTAARGDGIVNVRVCVPRRFPSDPFVAFVKVRVPAVTVKPTVLLVPPGVVTLTVLADTVALVEIVKRAVTVVALTTVTLLTVMPVPDTFTADVPVRFVPVKVTGTATPRPELAGEIDVSVGSGTLAPNSTAPTSTEPLVFLKVPKKSSLGATV